MGLIRDKVTGKRINPSMKWSLRRRATDKNQEIYIQFFKIIPTIARLKSTHNNPAAQADLAPVKDSALARGDSALWAVKLQFALFTIIV